MQLWPLTHAASTFIPDADKDAPFQEETHLGYGLLRPFQRDEKGTFATGTGERLWRSRCGQIIGTTCQSEFTHGELLWRTEFGSLVNIIRHRANTFATEELARVYVVDAFRKWMTSAVVTGSSIERIGRAMYVTIVFDMLDVRGSTLSTGNTARVPIL